MTCRKHIGPAPRQPRRLLPDVSLVYSTHRPETLVEAGRRMADHASIFLEEPPTPGFYDMLDGRLPVADYLAEQDLEYPEFSRESCRLLQTLYRNGHAVFQVEPYLAHLLAIHDFFADGGAPADLEPDTPRTAVYAAEKAATGALLDFYRNAAGGSFASTVSSVKAFARADARRFVLRDKMRADALADRLSNSPRAYVEAGVMHVWLWNALHRRLPRRIRMRPVWLLEAAARRAWGRRHTFGPGDLLTISYMYHPKTEGPHADLLAARSLIYSKILEKAEMAPSGTPFPHLENEVATIQTVSRLDLADCRTLYPVVRRLKTDDARSVVSDYLGHRDTSEHPSGPEKEDGNGTDPV